MRFTKLAAAVLLLSPLPPVVFSQSHPSTDSTPKTDGIQVYAAPEESTLPIAVLSAGETTTPVAESQGSAGVKWYLIKSKSGVVGWIKQSESEQSRKLDRFFNSLPTEPSISAQIPLTSSTSAPRGAVIVPVLLAGRAAIVPVIINQSLRGNLMLDTGATNTVLARRLAGLLSLRPPGTRTFQTVGGPISIGGSRLQSLKVAKLRLMI